MVPVLISHYDFLDAKKGALEHDRVKVKVLEAVDVGWFTGDAAQLAEAARERLLEVLRKRW